MLVDISPRRLRGRFVPQPLPPAGSFQGQIVLVTGGTTGIGLAAAVHFASLGADVIITSRTQDRGEAAVRRIYEAVGTTTKSNVSFLTLEMTSYGSCVAFVEQLKIHLSGRAGLDVAILNAGSINSHFEESPEGWEVTLQVNALSTALLGLLLLEWMKEERRNRVALAHLVFVTSRDHLYPDIKHWEKWAEQSGILRHLSSRRNWPAWWKTTEPNYANSKLVVMYAVDQICKLATGPDGQPEVIVNSVCPGLVNSDIGRSIAGRSRMMKLVVFAYLNILGKSPDYGARSCVLVASRDKEGHGKFSNAWLSDARYQRDTAKKVQALVWQEMQYEFQAKVPKLGEQSLALRRSD